MSKRSSVIPTDKIVITAVNGKSVDFELGKNPSLAELKRLLKTSEWGALMDHKGIVHTPSTSLTFYDLPAGNYTTCAAPRKITTRAGCNIL